MKNRELEIQKRSAKLGLSLTKPDRRTMMRSITQLTIDELTDELLTLPDGDRAMLANRLWASLHDDGLDEDDNTPLTPAWSAEIKRRIAAIENGTEQLIPGEEALAQARLVLERFKK
jgi:putative addiction module component (TIGR02574 family)